MDKQLVYENELAKFYTNDSTKMLDKECTRCFGCVDLPPLKNHHVLIAEEKQSGYKEYVLFNEKGEPVESATGIDTLGTKIDMLRRLQNDHT